MCKALGYTPETMVASASGYAALAFVLAIETGLRKHEIMALRWTDLLISEGSLKVPGGSQGAGRTVPLSPRAIQLFGQLYRFEDEERCIPLRKEDSQRMWMDARKKAATIVPSVHDLNFNDSRHEATARLAKKFSLLPLSRMLDHGNLATLVTYYLEE